MWMFFVTAMVMVMVLFCWAAWKFVISKLPEFNPSKKMVIKQLKTTKGNRNNV